MDRGDHESLGDLSWRAEVLVAADFPDAKIRLSYLDPDQPFLQLRRSVFLPNCKSLPNHAASVPSFETIAFAAPKTFSTLPTRTAITLNRLVAGATHEQNGRPKP